jgi:LmbE family N-acetylglucosaminyl deacetylase
MYRWLIVISLVVSTFAWGELPKIVPDRGQTAFEQAVKRAGTDLKLMCLAAHPDDEDGATLAYFGLGKGISTTFCLANWGEGGQNEIGPELYEQLALIRSRETMAAARLIGADVLCMNLKDFGYSKTQEETIRKWGSKNMLRKMVFVIRKVQPDVIVTNHRENEGHGHHQALAALLPEAVKLAAMSDKFPDQIKRGLWPWKVSRVYQRRNLPYLPNGENFDVEVPVGTYDKLRGVTYAQIAGAALQCHRSQGTWFQADKLAPSTYFKQILPVDGKPASGLLDGLEKEHSLARGYFPVAGIKQDVLEKAGYKKCQKALAKAVNRMDGSRKDVGKALADALKALRKTRAKIQQDMSDAMEAKSPGVSVYRAAIQYLYTREVDISNALGKCSGLHVSASLDDPTLVRRQEFTTTINLANRGAGSIKNATAKMLLPYGWRVIESGPAAVGEIAVGDSASLQFKSRVYSESPIYGEIENLYKKTTPPTTPVRVRVTATAFNVDFTNTIEVPAQLLGKLSVLPQPHVIYVAPPQQGGRSLTFHLRAVNNSHETTNCRFTLTFPSTLRKTALEVSPSSREFKLQPDGSWAWKVGLKIPADMRKGEYTAFAIVESDKGDTAACEMKVVVLDATLPASLKVGVLPSYDDTLANSLASLGASVEQLQADRLSFRDLSQFDSIFVDIRAYLAHKNLPQHNKALLDYARSGGNLVVMYHKTAEWKSEYAPYPLELGRDRVSVEESEVRVQMPLHPLMTWPNQLHDEDWKGWIQERGLYFPSKADDHYSRLLILNDPEEPPLTTGYLVAEVGEGSYIYTSLVWYRQLRNGHEGAYRALANMAAYPRRERK